MSGNESWRHSSSYSAASDTSDPYYTASTSTATASIATNSAWSSQTPRTASSHTTYDLGPPLNPLPTEGAVRSTITLPCEFVGLTSCNQSFDYDDTDNWKEHIIRYHLQDKLPRKASCWFCDEFEFDANVRNLRGDRRANFENRMNHIRHHILEDHFSIYDIRPDHHMLEHLNRHHLISREDYEYALGYNDKVPAIDGIYQAGFVPPERQLQRNSESRAIVDDSKDERRRRRRQKNH